MEKGSKVKLIKQGTPHAGGAGSREVKIGTEGEVIALRNNSTELLVKFKGVRTYRHTELNQVELINN